MRLKQDDDDDDGVIVQSRATTAVQQVGEALQIGEALVIVSQAECGGASRLDVIQEFQFPVSRQRTCLRDVT